MPSGPYNPGYSSVLWHVSSSNAVRGSIGLFQNGSFSVTAGNSDKIQQAVKVVPVKAFLPNVFNNVHEYNNDVAIHMPDHSNPALRTVALNVPHQFYDSTQLTAALNNAWAVETAGLGGDVGSVLFAVADTNHISISTTAADGGNASHLLVAPSEFHHLLGFQTHHEPHDHIDFQSMDDPHRVLLSSGVNVPGGLQTGLPGLSHVHIAIPEMGNNNLVSSTAAGQALNKNVVMTIPLSDTPFGSYACQEVDDVDVHDVDFLQPLSLQHLTVTS